MLAERKRIQLAKQGSIKKGATESKKLVPKPKPEWNNWLTDDREYKADQEKLLLKKKLLVSQNNIFVANGDVSLGIRPKSRPVHAPEVPTTPSPVKKPLAKKEVNALDLIISAKDKEIGRKSSVPVVNRFERSKSANRTTRELRHGARIEKENVDFEDDRDDGNRLAVEWMGRSASDVNSAHSRELAARRREFLLSGPQDQSLNQSCVSAESKSKSLRNSSPSKSSTSNRGLSVKAPNGIVSGSTSINSSPVKRPKNITEDKDYDLVYVADEIRSLFSELKYYEELSGRRSILDTREELDAMLQDEALLDPQSHKPVMRYLVQLVCQSMTYLLKSEVDLQDERKRYEQLSAKFETLNALLAPDSVVPNVADFKHVSYSADLLQSSAEHDTSGIAFEHEREQRDLFPQPRRGDHGDKYVSAHSAHPHSAPRGVHSEQEHEYDEDYMGGSSSAMRALAQQYAQGDYYPLHGDRGEHAQPNSDALYASLEGAGIRAYPSAQFTSTPARFQEKMAVGASIAASKGAKLAANPVPGAVVATPVQQDSRASQKENLLQNGYNSVSSTCSTPPMSLLHKKYVYSTASMLAPPSTTQESAQKHPYVHIASPAPYVDAYSSYLSAGADASTSVPSKTMTEPVVSAGALSTPTKGNVVTSQAAASAVLLGQADAQNSETDDQAMSAGLSRLDELIRYSKSIANNSYCVGDEFSTIARLTDSTGAYRALNAAADDSILSSPDASQSANVDSKKQDSAVQAPRPPTEAVNMYAHMYNSRDSEFSLPPPPPPSLPAGPAQEKYGSLVMRQPAAATASRIQLLTQQHGGTPATGSSAPVVTPTVSSLLPAATMSGTSPSDWLFNTFPAKAVASSGESSGARTMQSPNQSLPITPEVVFSPPTSAQQSVGMVTPSRDFIKVNLSAPQPTVNLKTGAINTKVRSPGTRDLFNQQMGSGGSATAGSGLYSLDESMDDTVSRLADQTSHLFAPDASPVPAPRAAVPTYLLEQQQKNSAAAMPSKPTKPAQTIVQRIPSPSAKPAVPKRVTVFKPRAQQDQASIIVPNGVVPSPQSAPVHPYARGAAQSTYQQKLQNLQSEVESNSNATTPVMKLQRWAPPALVLDATSGSF